MSVRRAHHRERDAGVAGRRLDDGLPGLQHAASLGVLDDRVRETILHRAIGLNDSTFTYIVT